MTDRWSLAADLAVLAALLLGIRRFRRPDTARGGTVLAAAALLGAIGLEVARCPPHSPALAILALAVGSSAGWTAARKTNMTQIPAMVAVQNGAGGLAAMIVSCEELTRQSPIPSPVSLAAALLGVLIGAVTAGGSVAAAAKLARLWKQTPTALPAHAWLNAAALATTVILGAAATTVASHPARAGIVGGLGLMAVLLGLLFSMRVGGADMPVLISFLNALSGLAGASCGIAMRNHVLIACGAMVAASGLILTCAMCQAMNRNLLKVLIAADLRPESVAAATTAAATASQPLSAPAESAQWPGQSPLSRAVEATRIAKKVIIIPGYGMALAHAQFEVVKVANRLKELGKEVKFAIHPIAGRMPGHMHVLLAEAEADSDMLFDLPEINPEFQQADLALVVGACDVVNPAAINVEGTPISGMPILAAHEAKQILVCNLDDRPGYSGVQNPLYASPKTILVLGDAKTTLSELLRALN